GHNPIEPSAALAPREFSSFGGTLSEWSRAEGGRVFAMAGNPGGHSPRWWRKHPEAIHLPTKPANLPIVDHSNKTFLERFFALLESPVFWGGLACSSARLPLWFP